MSFENLGQAMRQYCVEMFLPALRRRSLVPVSAANAVEYSRRKAPLVRRTPFLRLARPATACATTLIALLLVAPLQAAQAKFDPLAEASNAPALAEFVDEDGHLSLPPGFSGTLDPTGFDLISGQGEVPRFAATMAKGGNSPDDLRWADEYGLPNGCNGQIHAIATGSGGEIYLGGSFTLCGDSPANNIVRYEPIAGTWSALGSDGGNGVDLQVDALVVSGSDLYVGGTFTQVNVGASLPANRIARWDGSAWSALGSGGGNGVSNGVSSTTVKAFAVSGSDLYVGGDFTQVNAGADIPANGIARWDGSTWSALGSGGGNGVLFGVNALAVSGGDLYVGGSFLVVNAGADISANNIARWNGSSWSALGSGGGNGVSRAVDALAVSGGDLYVGGSFTQANIGAPITANGIARWDGSAWSAVGGSGGNGVDISISAMAVSGSDLYVGGYFTQVNFGANIPANSIARWNGSAWSALGSGGGNGVNAEVLALAVSGSDLYVGGSLISQTNVGDDVPANQVARWDGSTWSALGNSSGNGGNSAIRALAVSGSDLYVGGVFTHVGGIDASRIARWDGNTWSALGSGDGNGVGGGVLALALSGNDLYVGGVFSQANFGADVPARNIARWDGSAWSALGSGGGNGVNSTVSALAVSGSDLYVGGFFTQANAGADVPANRIARWDGSSWSALGSGGGNGVNNTVRALAVSGSDLYVGGAFSQANVGANVPANGIARWDGSTWSALGSDGGNGVLFGVNALAVSGRDLYVGGGFSVVNAGADVAANRIARWDGSAWSALGSGGGNGVNSTVSALAVSGGDLYVGGFFTQANVGVGTITTNRVARWNGSSWSALGSGVSFRGVSTLAVTDETTLYLGGSFGSAGGKPSSNIARYAITPPLQLSALPATVLVGDPSTISVSGGFGSGAVTVELSSGAAFCSLSGSTLTALAPGECLVTATKAGDAAYPAQTSSVLVRPVTVPGVNLVVEFNALLPGGATSFPPLLSGGQCQERGFRVSVRNNGPMDAADVQLEMPAPSGLLSPVAWFCVLANGQCLPETGQGAVDARFALDVGAEAEINLSACPDPVAAFAEFQFQASVANGTLLFPLEAQGRVSTPLNNDGLFRSGFE